MNPTGQICYYINLLELLEHANRLADLEKWLVAARNNFPDQSFTLYEAYAARRKGNIQEAVSLLRSDKPVEDGYDALIRHELGMLYDRLEEADKAFKCFENVNAFLDKRAEEQGIDRGLIPGRIADYQKILSKEWFEGWRQGEDYPVSSPVFLVGFPRSGTTLLGHILGCHPGIFTAQEIPALEQLEVYVEKNLPGYPETLSSLQPSHIRNLQQSYFKVHKKFSSWEPDQVFIDKIPLNFNAAALIHKIFPEAEFVFIKRHPYDCVLSCFMQNFILNGTNVHFLDLKNAARLYAQSMDLWEAYQKVLPMRVHTVSYEGLVSDFRKEVGGVLDFIGLPWDDRVLDFHEAKSASVIVSASYAHVSEELYDRSKFRWLKYKKQLEPIMEVLAPNVGKFGYKFK